MIFTVPGGVGGCGKVGVRWVSGCGKAFYNQEFGSFLVAEGFLKFPEGAAHALKTVVAACPYNVDAELPRTPKIPNFKEKNGQTPISVTKKRPAIMSVERMFEVNILLGF